MHEIETKIGSVKVYQSGHHIYLRTSGYVQPMKEPPELIEGQQVRLSADEARIIARALMRCVAEAEKTPPKQIKPAKKPEEYVAEYGSPLDELRRWSC